MEKGKSKRRSKARRMLRRLRSKRSKQLASGALVTFLTGLLIVVAIIGTFFSLYKWFLGKWLAKWIDPVLAKIPLVGKFMMYKKNEYLSINTPSGFNPIYPGKYVNLGFPSRGDGRAYTWQKHLGNDPHGDIKKLIPEESLPNRQPELDRYENTAESWQRQQKPTRVRVLEEQYKCDKTPSKFTEVLNKEKEIRDDIEKMFMEDGNKVPIHNR